MINNQLKQIQWITKSKIAGHTMTVQSDFVNCGNDNVMNWKSIRISVNLQNMKSTQKIQACWRCDQKNDLK